MRCHPGTNTERELLEIWERVLDIGGLGVEDDFFELGGESLAAVTLFTEMERVLGLMPPLSSLLECPTVRRLARHLDLLAPTEKTAPIQVPPRRRRGWQGGSQRCLRGQ